MKILVFCLLLALVAAYAGGVLQGIGVATDAAYHQGWREGAYDRAVYDQKMRAAQNARREQASR